MPITKVILNNEKKTTINEDFIFHENQCLITFRFISLFFFSSLSKLIYKHSLHGFLNNKKYFQIKTKKK